MNRINIQIFFEIISSLLFSLFAFLSFLENEYEKNLRKNRNKKVMHTSGDIKKNRSDCAKLKPNGTCKVRKEEEVRK